jgi:hypothetical protein
LISGYSSCEIGEAVSVGGCFLFACIVIPSVAAKSVANK